MKTFKQLRKDVSDWWNSWGSDPEADMVPLKPSARILVRPTDARHRRLLITVMMKKPRKWQPNQPAYDWTLREPTGRTYYGTIKKMRSTGGWNAYATDGKINAAETDTSKDSLKALRKAYKKLCKLKNTTFLNLPISARGNSLKTYLT